MTPPARRRAVLSAALATATLTAFTPPGRGGRHGRGTGAAMGFVDHHSWTTTADWLRGTSDGVRVERAPRPGIPGIAIHHPAGTTHYTDPHTGHTAAWEYATWTSPTRVLPRGATEAVASWNADTPPGTWLQAELRGAYGDGRTTPWYVMGRWAAGDADIRRTSVDGQSDGRSAVDTDTLALDAAARSAGLRLTAYQLRLTLYRRPGSGLTPLVRRIGAMASDIPDRFTVPASVPGEGASHELPVPRYSQETHKGQYPRYDNGGEAWCSPTTSQMVIDYWGRGPTRAELAWVNPAYADPQVDQAARHTYDYQYRGCGNWPFNAAYAATRPGLNAVVTRLRSLGDVEHLIRHGIPVMTSQSFLAPELGGAGYGTAGHLMCVVGFTPAGDVIANDPAAPDDRSVRRIYHRREFETIWLRTKRHGAKGQVTTGSGGICYLYWPTDSTPAQRRALRDVGVR